jgi:hypothetical protein
MGLGADEAGDRRSQREELGRRLVEKLRRFAASELDGDETAMLRALLNPGLQLLLPGSEPLSPAGDDVIIPRGMSGVISKALLDQIDRDPGDHRNMR